jgi:hypothetical protein
VSSNEIELPELGLVRREAGLHYSVTDPVPPYVVSALIQQKWCQRIRVSDGTGGAAKFTALCEVDGEPVVVTGVIGNC